MALDFESRRAPRPAAWAARHQALPGNPRLTGRLDAVAAIGRLPRLDPAVAPAGPGIGGRPGALDRPAGLASELDGWGAPPDPDAALDELILAAARVLAARSDSPIAFCHAVTAPAAVRLVLPVLPAALGRRVWRRAGRRSGHRRRLRLPAGPG